jgi:MFS family permease
VSDLFFVHQRGTMNGIYLILVIVGNYLGPVAAGYVAVSQNWRWVFWYCVIFMSIVTLVMVFFLEESKYVAPAMDGLNPTGTIDEDDQVLSKINSASKDPVATRTGSISVAASEAAAANTERRRLVEIDRSIPMNSYRQRLALWSPQKQATTENRSLWKHFIQPFHILITFPAVAFTALQYGFLIAMLAILAVTQATLYPFPPYNFSPIGIGNMNLPPAIGAILGSIFGGPLNDWFILQIAKRRNGIYEPETRLWLFLIPGACMPIGLFMYGLTISKV